MKIAITSGKGGVGKTFVAACLAAVIAETQDVTYIDCDVEAPNGHLFLHPENVRSDEQIVSCIVDVDRSKCTFCGRCAKACYFNALIVGKNNAVAFPELCRSCGACQIVCPYDALVNDKRVIGTVYQANSGHIALHWATLAAGAGGMTVRLIEQIKNKSPKPQRRDELTILDSPPGTSCSVVHTIRDADHVVLVGDPTRFGHHDLKLSVSLCRSMGIEPAIIINRAGIGDLNKLRKWCRDRQLEIAAEIPDQRNIAELYSKGILPIQQLPELKSLFREIADNLLKRPLKPIVGPKQAETENLFYTQTSETPLKASEAQQTNTHNPEITIVSGKGGTGKTSLAACFAQLAGNTVADCDVDAADMHLLFEPEVIESDTFIGGRVMSINPQKCTGCGRCLNICNWNAIAQNPEGTISIKEEDCEGCGACLYICPADAIRTETTEDGRWYWSAIRHGRMSHATLEPGKENSGKMVTLVRKNAAQKKTPGKIPIILDGSPGTGCPVIASVGGAAAAVIVTEPTVSGLHDLGRILELTAHFKVPAGVIINKTDINPQMSEKIKILAREKNADVLGELPYNTAFVQAQQEGKTLLEYQPDSEISNTIKNIWKIVQTKTENSK